MLDDRVLVWRFNRGDTDALRRIYGKYRDDLLKVAAALLNDRAAVEDVVHDVFVSFAEIVGQFRLCGSLKGYLSICVANCARDRNRAVQRRRTASLDEKELDRPEVDRPDKYIARGEMAGQIDRAMTQLPQEQREVIVLHLQSKMKFRQIARSQGVSVNTVMSRYRYGLNKLRSTLDGELER
ncbi:MAG: RNA polymerase sigma factor [Phycisphaerales bacterium]|nr:MAG: RNA polymerase sigma factor [Phycisphaerales bacterium]UCF14092.1 MAG: RNA polymerase sigma factor [Phycisphaerales bacterium]